MLIESNEQWRKFRNQSIRGQLAKSTWLQHGLVKPWATRKCDLTSLAVSVLLRIFQNFTIMAIIVILLVIMS